MHTTLTSKGQITLPKGLRDKLCLSAGDRIEFVVEDNRSVRLLAKPLSVNRLKGMLPRPDKPISLEEMNKAIRYFGNRRI